MDKGKQKGITLIALIITIIVMLILVAVVVRTVVESGLFKHATNATARWKFMENQEQKLGEEVGDLVAKETPHKWERIDDNISCTHCGKNLVIGDFLDYIPDATTETVIVTKKEAGLLEVNRVDGTSIDPTTVSDQTFTQDPTTYWQVLGIEDSDGDGKNETLLIKMATGTTTFLELKGAAAYNNGQEIMNRIAKTLYSSSQYGEARSINITDINNTLQYKPRGGHYQEKGLNKGTDGFVTISQLPIWDTIKENPQQIYTPDGTNTLEKLGLYKADGYWYKLNDDGTGVSDDIKDGETTNISAATRDVIFKTLSGETAGYWIACRGSIENDQFRDEDGDGISDVGYYGFADFGLGMVAWDCVGASSFCFSSMGGVYGYTYPVCPVVSLKFEIPNKIDKPE